MKGRIKILNKRIIKNLATIWMVVSILALSYVVYAAYNGTAIVKRVVSTQASSNSSFSSNYMEVYSTTNLSVKNLRTINEGNFICPVTVCNYDQLDPTSPARAAIEYEFTAELVRYDSATNSYVPVTSVQMEGSRVKTFYVQKVMDDNRSIDTDPTHNLNTGTFSYSYSAESLGGGNSLRDTYHICFDAAEVAQDVPELFIRVSAIPSSESQTLNGSGVSNLGCIISIAQGRTVETGWHGSLQEESNKDYDGYNLIIEGSGAGTIDILWNDTLFAMNPVFVAQYADIEDPILTAESSVSGQTGWKKRTLNVDSASGDNRYVVQFYKRQSGSYTGTEFPSKYIKCENYVQAADGSPSPEPEP